MRSPLIAALLLLTACHASPEVVIAGEDHCDECRMLITDPRFGGEVINSHGRVTKFDSLSCLLRYLKADSENGSEVFVSDYLHPGALIPAGKAYFLKAAALHSPMGPGLIASADEAALERLRSTLKGEKTSWSELRSSSPPR